MFEDLLKYIIFHFILKDYSKRMYCKKLFMVYYHLWNQYYVNYKRGCYNNKLLWYHTKMINFILTKYFSTEFLNWNCRFLFLNILKLYLNSGRNNTFLVLLEKFFFPVWCLLTITPSFYNYWNLTIVQSSVGE